jgi:myosin V
MRNMENELKSLKQVLKDKETNIVNLTKQFEEACDEKMTMLEQNLKGEADWKKKNELLEKENVVMKMQVIEMKEAVMKDGNFCYISDLSTFNGFFSLDQTARTRLLSEVDSNELHYAYQKTVKDKDLLESENNSLKKELQRYKNLIIHQHDLNSLSPRNSISPNPIDDDGGYSSAKNTLELRRKSVTAEGEWILNFFFQFNFNFTMHNISLNYLIFGSKNLHN